MGGAVIDSGRFDWAASGRFPGLAAPAPAYHGLNFQETFGDMAFTMQAHAVGLRDLGATMAPMNALQKLLGPETLSLPMERQCCNSRPVAAYLQGPPPDTWAPSDTLPPTPHTPRSQKSTPHGHT